MISSVHQIFRLTKSRKAPLLGGIGLFLIALDQLAKFWAQNKFASETTCNVKTAFGLFGFTPWMWLAWILVVGLFGFIAFRQLRENGLASWGSLFVLSGALSNGLERMFSGCVIDFISLPYWPLFNLADAYITIGAIIIVIKISKFKIQS